MILSDVGCCYCQLDACSYLNVSRQVCSNCQACMQWPTLDDLIITTCFFPFHLSFFLSFFLSFSVKFGSVCPHWFTFTWSGCWGWRLWHKPTELAHSILFCSCVCLCPYGSFTCISLHKFSWQLYAFSLCSSGLSSALLVLSTTYLSMKVSLSPDIILCGWLGLKHQLTDGSVQVSIYAFGNAFTHSTPSLRSFPRVVLETVPVLVSLSMAPLSLFKKVVECVFLIRFSPPNDRRCNVLDAMPVQCVSSPSALQIFRGASRLWRLHCLPVCLLAHLPWLRPTSSIVTTRVAVGLPF